MSKLNVLGGACFVTLKSDDIRILVWLYGRVEVNYDIGSTIGDKLFGFKYKLNIDI
jgi:hypothetical protein